MIARYDGEKLNGYVIEGLAIRARPGDSAFLRQSELFTARRVGRAVARRLMARAERICG